MPMENRREIFQTLAALFAAGAIPAEMAAATLPDAVITRKQAKVKHDPFGDTTIYFEGSTGQLSSMTAGDLLLKAGMEPHPPHQHPEEEFVLVTEGQAEILVDGKKSVVGPGAMMYCQGNKLHGIKNVGKIPMRFYFFKWGK